MKIKKNFKKWKTVFPLFLNKKMKLKKKSFQ